MSPNSSATDQWLRTKPLRALNISQVGWKGECYQCQPVCSHTAYVSGVARHLHIQIQPCGSWEESSVLLQHSDVGGRCLCQGWRWWVFCPEVFRSLIVKDQILGSVLSWKYAIKIDLAWYCLLLPIYWKQNNLKQLGDYLKLRSHWYYVTAEEE